jgi:RNA polymerase sigma factor (TIGR02999 family)
MADQAQHDVTRLLRLAGDGDSRATDELLPLLYEELRRMARAQLAGELPGATLQPTALVHEAYMRLVGDGDVSWNSRGHFFGAAGQAMRRILVDRARRRGAAKRGGDRHRVELGDEAIKEELEAESMLAIDEVLTQLEAYDATKAQLVTLRYFAGLSLEQTAAAMGVSLAAVREEWAFARAWMHRRLQGSGASDGARG